MVNCPPAENAAKAATQARTSLAPRPAASRTLCRLTCLPYFSYRVLLRIGGAPHEIHQGEWPDAAPKAFLRVLRLADRSRLPARNQDAPHLLRSRLLRRSLQKPVHASRTTGNGIMSASQPNKLGLWPESSDEHGGSRRGPGGDNQPP